MFLVMVARESVTSGFDVGRLGLTLPGEGVSFLVTFLSLLGRVIFTSAVVAIFGLYFE
jgi:hypothetical protein